MKATLSSDNVSALIAIGGEDTLGVAKLAADGVRIVGVPKTIDNDLSATDFTLGSTPRCRSYRRDRPPHTTAESHDRVMVVEVMGRHAGWIATCGAAGGADMISFRGAVRRRTGVQPHHAPALTVRASRSSSSPKAPPAEGTMELASGDIDEFGHVRLGGVGNQVADEIERRAPASKHATNLATSSRRQSDGLRPRRATRFGIEAIDAVHEGEFGVVLRGTDIVRVPIEAGVEQLKTVDPKLYDTAAVFFG